MSDDGVIGNNKKHAFARHSDKPLSDVGGDAI